VNDLDPAQALAAELRRLVRSAERAAGRKLDRPALARAIHVSPQSLYAYLDGARLPPPATLDALLVELGADEADLRRAATLRDEVDEDRRRRRVPSAQPPAAPELARRRPPVRLLAAVALVVGAGTASAVAAPWRWTRSSSSASRAPGDPLYSATVGADCPARAGAEVRAYGVAGAPWSVGTKGGWSGDGCFGEYFFAVPGQGSSVRWVAAQIADRPVDCLVSIHVADSPHSAGTAHYVFTTGGAPTLATIDQAAHHGDWVGNGPFRVSGGRIQVELLARDPATGEVTAGPVHVYCTPPGQ
jgi:hypothetical protein